jgi:hypothetical protein
MRKAIRKASILEREAHFASPMTAGRGTAISRERRLIFRETSRIAVPSNSALVVALRSRMATFFDGTIDERERGTAGGTGGDDSNGRRSGKTPLAPCHYCLFVVVLSEQINVSTALY